MTLAEEHWAFIEKVLDRDREVAKFLFLAGFEHGAKHQREDDELMNTGTWSDTNYWKENVDETTTETKETKDDKPSQEGSVDAIQQVHSFERLYPHHRDPDSGYMYYMRTPL